MHGTAFDPVASEPSPITETACTDCPLQPPALFVDQTAAPRYTRLSGWAFRYKTLSDAVFRVVQRDALWELHRRSPTMGFNVTWLIAQEESLVDGKLLSVGRRSAEERIATLLILPFKRAAGCCCMSIGRPTNGPPGGCRWIPTAWV